MIPRVLECFPQRIDPESFLLAVHMAAEAGNTYFRLGYNSLGAFATINHLHFQVSSLLICISQPIKVHLNDIRTCELTKILNQAYYLAVPFPIEKAPMKKIITLKDGVLVSELLKYPVRGLVFEGGNSLQALSNSVSDACICLQENNIPFNVLIADCGQRIFLLPQVS